MRQQMSFIDEAHLSLRSGDGGSGAVHFMRMKNMPRMGPDGGNGGRGGHIYFEATEDMNSLLDFKFKRKFVAENGVPGAGARKDGRMGQDLIIKVPCGTQVFDAQEGTLLADLTEVGVKKQLLEGGQGGMGNAHFVTPKFQAPDKAQPGQPGQSLGVKLELKLLADVALVGFPNAGKSTFISSVSAAKPKIASYPFTTLVPNLGVVQGKTRNFVIADVPGIIEGAHEGRGLGHQFLKHCERCRLLLLFLDADPYTGRSFQEEYKMMDNELNRFSKDLAAKPRVLLVNKSDLGLEELLKEKDPDGFLDDYKGKLFTVSAVAQQGLEPLLNYLEEQLLHLKKEKQTQEEASFFEKEEFQEGDASLLEE